MDDGQHKCRFEVFFGEEDDVDAPSISVLATSHYDAVRIAYSIFSDRLSEADFFSDETVLQISAYASDMRGARQ